MKLVKHLAYLIRYWQRNKFLLGTYTTPRKIFNFLIAEQEFKHRTVNVSSHPREVFIDPVNLCPLKCPLCATGMRLQGREAGMLSLEKYQFYLDQLSPWLYRVKLFNYGEPFLNPALFDMITYTHQKRVAVQVNSNLNVWQDSFAERCVKSGLDTLTVSFDGVSQQGYSSYRTGGDVEKVKQAVEQLVAAKKRLGAANPNIVLQFLMQKHNVHEYDAVALYAQKNNSVFSPQPLTFDITDPSQYAQWLPDDTTKTHYDRGHRCRKKLKPETQCGFLWNNPVINVDGGVSPCCHVFYPGTDFGSLEKNSFKEIWNNEAFRAARSIQHDRTLSQEPIVCNRCLNEKAFTDAHYDLVNEYRSNLLQ